MLLPLYILGILKTCFGPQRRQHWNNTAGMSCWTLCLVAWSFRAARPTSARSGQAVQGVPISEVPAPRCLISRDRAQLVIEDSVFTAQTTSVVLFAAEEVWAS